MIELSNKKFLVSLDVGKANNYSTKVSNTFNTVRVVYKTSCISGGERFPFFLNKAI